MIKKLLQRIFIQNWPRKLVALIAAIFIWFLVNQTITMAITIPDVPIRIINLSPDKTVQGLRPNGLLTKRLAITLTGTKSVLENIHPGDLEVVINAEEKKEGWIAKIDKKSLVSLSPYIDLKDNVSGVSARDLYIKLSNLVTAQIPLIITEPIGDAPKGYQFLNIWPQQLVQTVSGPQEQIRQLKKHGLELTFNLNNITKEELEEIEEHQSSKYGNVISFTVPSSWKQVSISFKDNAYEPLNDPRATFLKIHFLKQELLPLGVKLPIALFFPKEYNKELNPDAYSLQTNSFIDKKNGIDFLTPPLYARYVTRQFLDIVQNNLQITIIVTPKDVQDPLKWTLQIVNQKALEEKYVKAALKLVDEKLHPKTLESYLRHRFRRYARKIVLYTGEEQQLILSPTLEKDTISVTLNGN